MGNYVVILDTYFYTKKAGGTLHLRGWIYSGTENAEIQVRADHVTVPHSVKRLPRPDVAAARKDLHFVDDRVGFDIEINELETWMGAAEALRVRAVCGGQKFPIFQKNMEEMRAEYQKDSVILYHTDQMTRRGSQIFLQGWTVFYGEELEKRFYDEDGTEITDVFWHYMNREDVRAEYGASKEECVGFQAEFPRNLVKGEVCYLVLKTGGQEKKIAFDMKKLDRENTRSYRIRKLLSPMYRERNLALMKERGLRTFADYLWKESVEDDSYAAYYVAHRATKRALRKQRKVIFENAPLFSIVVPLYKTPESYLKELLDSILAQSYEEWELCLADGSGDDTLGKYIHQNYRGESRIRYKLLKENTGIAGNTNRALEMARGDYIVFADHDDTLEPDALYQAACVFRDHSETELLYTDEDLMDKNANIYQSYVKPDFNLDLLRSFNYISHLMMVKTELYKKAGDMQSDYDGAQDYDFILRCIEKTNHIWHIPKVLYHWRTPLESAEENQNGQTNTAETRKRVLEAHYKRMGIAAEVAYTGTFSLLRTKFEINGNPKVSILIPNKDHTDDLEQCIRSIEEKSTWKNLEIVIIENNSEHAKTFQYYENIQKKYTNIKVATYKGSFNYSAINNFGARYADGDYYLLLNNDTEVITPDWLEQMLGYCQRDDVAIVGAKLYYPDDTLQHGGIVVGLGGFAGHIHPGAEKNSKGYMGRLLAAQEISAVTGACLMVKKSIYEELHGLDESFAVALNDVDFCLRARALGKKIVFVPAAELYHYESKSRGYEDTPEKQARFDKEVAHFQARYKDLLDAGDPYYNPQLTLEKGDCSMRKTYEFLKGR